MDLSPVRTHPDGADSSSSSSSWIIGICAVVFDIDVGQTLQFLYPEDCLSEEEQTSVAFHAFPDSLSMELYTRNAIRDSSFQFRIKRIPDSVTDGSPDFLYGYVFCRQRQDETLRRGGEQIAVVVLAAVPFSGVLLPVSIAAGHAYFSEGELALAQMYTQVASWPPPIPGSRVSLSAGHAMITGRVPYFALLPPPQPAVDPSVQATLLRRSQRQASIRRGGAIAIAGTPQLAHASSSGISISISDHYQQQRQRQISLAGDDSAAAVGDLERLDSAAVAAAAVAASWMSAHTGGDLPTSPTGSAWSMLGSDASAHLLDSSPGLLDASANGSMTGRMNSTSSIAMARANSSGAGYAGAFPLARLGSNGSQSSPALLGSAGSGEYCSSWISAALGQQWKLETPFPEVDAAAVLQPLLRHAWTLWQLLVTAQPLIVVGLTPRECSVAVSALMGLIAPLPYAADYRPYFTIHDPDFIPLSRGKLPQHSVYEEHLPESAAETAAGAAASIPQQPGLQEQSQQQQHEQASVITPSGNLTAFQPRRQQQQEQQSDLYTPNVAPEQQQQQKHRQQIQQQQQQAQQKQPSELPVLLGITNLYFIKMLPHWPNVVAVSKKEVMSRPTSVPGNTNGNSSSQLEQQLQGSGSGSFSGPGSRNSSSNDLAGTEAAAAAPAAAPRKAGLISSTAAAAMRAFKRHQQGPQHLLTDFSPHLWCASKPLIRPDNSLIASVTAALEKEQQGAAGVSNAGAGLPGYRGVQTPGSANRQLRRHFAELTAAFLAPFEQYFEPGVNGMVPRWDPDVFLARLKPAHLHPDLTARLAGSAASTAGVLYRLFIASPNFAFWFSRLREPVLHLVEPEPEQAEDGYDTLADVQRQQPEQLQEQQQGEAGEDSSNADAAAASAECEVTLVQAFLSAEQDLMAAIAFVALKRQQQPGEQQQQRALQARLVAAFTSMPKDLQVALISSPARRQLLEECLAALGDGQVISSSDEVESSQDLVADLQQLQQLVQELGGCQISDRM